MVPKAGIKLMNLHTNTLIKDVEFRGKRVKLDRILHKKGGKTSYNVI